MKYKEYLLQKVIPTYFMLVTFLVLFIWLAGNILEPDAKYGYDILLSPLIYAVIGILPDIFGYSKKEYTMRQTIVKKLIHLCVLIALILGFSYAMGVIKNWREAVAIFFGIVVIDGILEVILWRIELRTAHQLTQALSRFDDET
ncbi:hypothetical protein [Anaerosporobacter faecicola]|uniref:hypothetical protein n=1 Tax=Anaerosporobacter faecicola TaxID=2718714 RepID=UPI00143989D1|nr:hypothetical protein [Anaerosporobacter faecicola]